MFLADNILELLESLNACWPMALYQHVSPVGLAHCSEYRLADLKDSIGAILVSAGGIERLKAAGSHLLLKPNLLMTARPEEAVTTHPVFFQAVVEVLSDFGFILSAGDSPAVESMQTVAQRCGIADICRSHGVTMADFRDTVEVRHPEGRVLKRMTIARAIAEAEAVISLPKLKTHTQMYYTGAIKNLFGVVSGLEKSRYHVRFVEKKFFAAMINDIAERVNPVMSIMDGVVGMQGHGPRNGVPARTGFVAASYDSLALDLVCAGIIGYDPLDIPMLRDAVDRRGGRDYFDAIITAGSSPEELKPESFELVRITTDVAFLRKRLPRFLYNFIRNAALVSPEFNERCVLCRKCVQICSAEALSVCAQVKGGQGIEVDLSRCVRCYCCHEVCAYNAIDLKRHFRF
jgi:uncharacterized protein (DUF362 family)/Pyruvate/2-oxoacid:ferredoxin oxidoreductase delta subunit